MPITPDGFAKRIDRLRSDLVAQAGRAVAAVDAAVVATFARDSAAGAAVVEADKEIDRRGVDIERASVQLLEDATREGAALTAEQLRTVLIVVKVNNELERIADAGAAVGEMASTGQIPAVPPATFRVMANSVIGILESSVRAFERMDTRGALVVLASDEAVVAFKEILLREAQEQIAAGRQTVDMAFALHAMASQLERIADHCTNIAEQVIYFATGSIVRHTGGRWTEPEPASSA